MIVSALDYWVYIAEYDAFLFEVTVSFVDLAAQLGLEFHSSGIDIPTAPALLLSASQEYYPYRT